MKAVLGDKLLAKAGKLYLQFRLRHPAKIEQELSIKYDGQYRNAGLTLLFDVFMALAAVALVGLVTIVLYFTTA